MDLDYVAIDKLYVVCRDAFVAHYADLKKAKDDRMFFIEALQCELCANAISTINGFNKSNRS